MNICGRQRTLIVGKSKRAVRIYFDSLFLLYISFTHDTAFDSLSDEEWKKIEDACIRIQENHPGFFQFYNIHWYWHSNDCKLEMRWMVDAFPRLYIELGIILRARGLEGNWKNIQRCMTEEQKTIANMVMLQKTRGDVLRFFGGSLNKKLAKKIDTSKW